MKLQEAALCDGDVLLFVCSFVRLSVAWNAYTEALEPCLALPSGYWCGGDLPYRPIKTIPCSYTRFRFISIYSMKINDFKKLSASAKCGVFLFPGVISSYSLWTMHTAQNCMYANKPGWQISCLREAARRFVLL